MSRVPPLTAIESHSSTERPDPISSKCFLNFHRAPCPIPTEPPRSHDPSNNIVAEGPLLAAVHIILTDQREPWHDEPEAQRGVAPRGVQRRAEVQAEAARPARVPR